MVMDFSLSCSLFWIMSDRRLGLLKVLVLPKFFSSFSHIRCMFIEISVCIRISAVLGSSAAFSHFIFIGIREYCNLICLIFVDES